MTDSEIAYAISETPEGPFEFVNVFLESSKSSGWDINNCHNPYERETFMKKEFTLSDGTIWKHERVERPFVLIDETGKPIMLYVAVLDKNVTGNIAIPIQLE